MRVLWRSCAAVGVLTGWLAAAAADEPPHASEDPLSEAARRALEALLEDGVRWTDALAAFISDPQAYEPPETLPNGDIVIRRRKPLPEPDGLDL